MKTIEEILIKADPVIIEVRRAKVELAQRYDFDVVAMVRGLRERDENENANKEGCSGGDDPSPPTAPFG